MNEVKQCSAKVWPRDGIRAYGCANKAVAGDYCRVHDPEAVKKREKIIQEKFAKEVEQARKSAERARQKENDAAEAPTLRAQVTALMAQLEAKPALNTRVEHLDFHEDHVRVLNKHVIEVDFGYTVSGVIDDINHLSASTVKVSLRDRDAYSDNDTIVFTVCADVPIVVAVSEVDRGALVLVAPDPRAARTEVPKTADVWWRCASCGERTRGVYPRGCFGDQPCLNVTRVEGKTDAE